MEYEVRYYYPKSDLENLNNKLENIKELTKGKRTYEKNNTV